MSPEVAKKHVSQVKQLLGMSSIEKCMDSISDIITRNMKADKWQPSTVITYLASLTTYLHFLKFMVDAQQQGFSYDTGKLEVLRKVIAKWNKSLRKQHTLIKNRKAIQNKNIAKVNPDDFEKYFQSEHVKETKELMVRREAVGRTIHSRVRNYIIYRMLAANCHRAGNFMNAKCQEFLSAEKNLKNNMYVMNIIDHKTAGENNYNNII